ncbi:MAG: VOC family protein [Armatimonadota bacterium]|nr:VOC family protein [Armatimonadota bacterium]
MATPRLPALALGGSVSLGPVSLTVRSLERSLGFYCDILGCRIRRRDATMVEVGTEQTTLLELWERPQAKPRPPRTTGLYHVAFLLPTQADLARALQRLVALRYPIEGASDHLVSEAVYLADPDGHGMEIYADRPRDAWPYRNGLLEMATVALDVDDLMSALKADPRPWTGLPEGTRIGHVHLRVADLDAAEAFYRDVLGFDLMARYGEGACFLSAGGYHHHIGLNTWAGVGAPPPPRGAIGLRHFSVVLPGEAQFGAVADRVRAAGITVLEHPSGLLARDPSHNGVLLTTPTRASPA